MNLIYKHTSKTSSKSYIGKSMKGMKARWNEHKRDALLGTESHFYRAIRKYGADDFVSEIVESDIAKNILCDREKYWVRYYDSFTNGYNMTEGGDGISGFTHSTETKEKMSNSSKGKLKSKTHCNNIKKALKEIPLDVKKLKNKKHAEMMSGRSQTEESNLKRSKSMKGRKLSQEHIDNSAKARRGLKRTEEQNKRNSKRQKGKILSEETKKKIGESSKGRGSLVIKIFNTNNELVYTSTGNFKDFCKNKNLPYDALYKSYNKNITLYNTKQKLTFAKKLGFEKFEKWYAKKDI